MKSTDRLFQITQYLRSRRKVTAKQLSEWLEVSQRTIYRDMQKLLLSGVPINGEPGEGYWLEAGFDFPPLMFTAEELEALVTGLRLTMQCTDSRLKDAALTVLKKVEQSIPKSLLSKLENTPLDVPLPIHSKAVAKNIEVLRRAATAKVKVHIEYVDQMKTQTKRELRPLELNFWGKVWTVAAWCGLRQDFRNFRVDRIECVEVSNKKFDDEDGKTLKDYYRSLAEQGYCVEH